MNLEKSTKGKQNLKLKNSPQPIPDSGKFVVVIILLFLIIFDVKAVIQF